jgi:LysM repeat protein
VKVAALKPPTPRKSTRAAGAGSRTVVVRSGDTLGTIASRHGVSVTALKRVNGLSGSTIRAGQRLRLPA